MGRTEALFVVAQRLRRILLRANEQGRHQRDRTPLRANELSPLFANTPLSSFARNVPERLSRSGDVPCRDGLGCGSRLTFVPPLAASLAQSMASQWSWAEAGRSL